MPLKVMDRAKPSHIERTPIVVVVAVAIFAPANHADGAAYLPVTYRVR